MTRRPSLNEIQMIKKNRQIVMLGSISLLALMGLFSAAWPQSGAGSEAVMAETAQPAGNHTTAFTEEQVVEAALHFSKRVHSLSSNTDIAGQRLKSSGWIDNPELRISDVSTRYYTDEFEELEVGLRLRLPKLGQLGEEKQQARVDLWDYKVEEIRYRQEFIAKVRKEFADVLLFDQLAELAQKKATKADERVYVIEQLVGQGSRTVINLAKAKMWRAETQNDLARAQQNQNLGRRELAKRSGIAANALLLQDELPEVTLNLDELMDIAVQNRPEIEFVQHRIELARQQKQFEYLKLIPWFNFVEVSYHTEKPGDEDWGEFKAGINLPIFDWNLGNIKATQLAVENKEDEAEAVKEMIEEEVSSAYLIYKDLLLDWTNYRSSSEELLATAMAVLNSEKQHDILMSDDLAELEWTIYDMQSSLAEKRHELAHALFDLYFALGIKDHGKLLE
ncbi:TolC family protein [candidate division KSB1 bacterium]|nr:MAG: TolC family protein [candidate division KSB1 bacterium]